MVWYRQIWGCFVLYASQHREEDYVIMGVWDWDRSMGVVLSTEWWRWWYTPSPLPTQVQDKRIVLLLLFQIHPSSDKYTRQKQNLPSTCQSHLVQCIWYGWGNKVEYDWAPVLNGTKKCQNLGCPQQVLRWF